MKREEASSADVKGWRISGTAMLPPVAGSSSGKHMKSNVSYKMQPRLVGCLVVAALVVIGILLYPGLAPALSGVSQTHVSKASTQGQKWTQAHAQVRGGVTTFGSGSSSETRVNTVLATPSTAGTESTQGTLSLVPSLQQHAEEKTARYKQEDKTLFNHRSQESDKGAILSTGANFMEMGGLPVFGKKAVAKPESAIESTMISRKAISSSFTAATDSIVDTEAESNAVYPQDTIWSRGLKQKLQCVYANRGGLLLYHIRKAAGTTMREVMTLAAQRWHVPLYETEGLTLDWRFLTFPALKPSTPTPAAGSLSRTGDAIVNAADSFAQQVAKASLLSVITLRDPIGTYMQHIKIANAGIGISNVFLAQRTSNFVVFFSLTLTATPFLSIYLTLFPSPLFVSVFLRDMTYGRSDSIAVLV